MKWRGGRRGPRRLSTNPHKLTRILSRFVKFVSIRGHDKKSLGKMGAGESVKVEGGAKHFRVSTGGWAGFVSPAGRVRGRRRAAPSAFVVAAAVRLMAVGRALRADTKRRGAPFTKARVRGTRKRQGQSSRHESASPCSRISTCCEGRKTTDFTDWRGFLDEWKSEKSSALSSHFVKWRGGRRGDRPQRVAHLRPTPYLFLRSPLWRAKRACVLCGKSQRATWGQPPVGCSRIFTNLHEFN